jgi:hypothetical protein
VSQYVFVNGKIRDRGICSIHLQSRISDCALITETVKFYEEMSDANPPNYMTSHPRRQQLRRVVKS